MVVEEGGGCIPAPQRPSDSFRPAVGQLSTVYRLPSTVYRLPSAVCRLPSRLAEPATAVATVLHNTSRPGPHGSRRRIDSSLGGILIWGMRIVPDCPNRDGEMAAGAPP